MDSETYHRLLTMKLKNTMIVSREQLLQDDSMLLEAQNNRSVVEFYFTSKSFLCSYIFRNFPDVNFITYCDADMYFFNNPSDIKKEMQGYSVGITPHRFIPKLKQKEKFGLYNAGMICFRRDADGLACLEWWRSQCYSWCYDRVDNGLFADQKYLNYMSQNFGRVKDIEHKGVNTAPWNIGNYKTILDGEKIYIESDPLICFHFQSLKRISSTQFDSSFSEYYTRLNRTIKYHIYMPYIKHLFEISGNSQTEGMENGIRSFINARSQIKYSNIHRILAKIKRKIILSYYKSLIDINDIKQGTDLR